MIVPYYSTTGPDTTWTTYSIIIILKCYCNSTILLVQILPDYNPAVDTSLVASTALPQWDLRTFHLLHTVPALDQCRLVFNSNATIMYGGEEPTHGHTDGHTHTHTCR